MTTIMTVGMEQTKGKNATPSTKHVRQRNSHVKTLNVFATNIDVMVKMIVGIIQMKLAAVRILLYFVLFC